MTESSSRLLKKCFVCRVSIKKSGNLLTPEQSLYTLCRILEIPQLANELHRVMFVNVCYCSDCINNILELLEKFEQLADLETKIFQEKEHIKLQIKQSNLAEETKQKDDKAIGQGGMLHKLRGEIAKVMESSSSQFQSSLIKIPDILPSKKDSGSQTEALNDEMNKSSESHTTPILPMPLKQRQILPASPKSKSANAKQTTAVSMDITPTSKIRITSSRISKTTALQKITKVVINEEETQDENVAVGKQDLQKSPKRNSQTVNDLPLVSQQNGTSKISAPSLQPKKCKKCGKMLSSRQAWKNHLLAVHHQGKSKFICKVCGHGAQRQSDLKRHLTTHSSKAKFKCSSCPKSFKVKYHLDQHLRLHTKEGRRFQCEFCSKKFLTAAHVRRHQEAEVCKQKR